MQSPRLTLFISLSGHIAAIFAAVSGGILMLERLGINFHQTGSFFNWLFWPAVAVCLLAAIARLPAEARSRATDVLFGIGRPKSSPDERIGVAKVAAFFLVLFAILLWKNSSYLRTEFEIRWHIAFLNYDLAWHTPIFSLAGNILYQFEIQPPFNTSLAPLNGVAYFINPHLRIIASFTLFYLAMSALLWAVGCAMGLKPVARAVCTGLTALITTIPYGLDHLLPFLPPPFVFVSQAMLTSVYEELGILSLTTVVLFFWIGQRQSFLANTAFSLAFSASCYIVLLAYPALAFFSTPVIFFYCCAFLATVADSRELWWKLAVSGTLLATMLAARIPLFFKNLYSYTYGAYFSDRIVNSDSRLTLWKNSTVLGVFWPDSKVLLLCLVSCASAIFFIVRGNRVMRRFAIATLAGEAGLVAMGAVIAYLHYPLSLYYSDQLQAPIPVLFAVVSLFYGVAILAARCDEALKALLERANKERSLPRILSERMNWYAAAFFLFLAASPFLVPRERPFDNSQYPPAQPPSVTILENELGLRSGKKFAGRVLTLVLQDLPASATAGSNMNPLLTAILGVLENRYGRYTGNDHWNDLLNLNIPVAGEYGQWATPINFVLMHEFFLRKDDNFQKSAFLLRSYNDRVAHMIGIRYVVSDAASIPGGALVYQRMAGDTPLRLFRIDDTNLGQYSPTKVRQITTAAEGLAAIKSNSFDPQQDAVVEEDLPANLVFGKLQSLTVELGPALHVQAQSAGTSLLVLPFEYSHCLRLSSKDGSSARLVPVNLQQTGLLFDRHVDVEISYSFGPLDQPACRGDDLSRMDRLRLRDAL